MVDNKPTREQVVKLMESSQSEAEWTENCDTVKATFGDYPDYWYEAILKSGVAKRTLAKFGADADLHVIVLPVVRD